MINLLTGDLPKSVIVKGKEYDIYTDFRDYIELQQLLKKGTNEQIAEYIIGLFIDGLPFNKAKTQEEANDLFIDALNQIVNFFRMEEDQEEKREETEGQKRKRPSFSFDDDMAYVIGAFREAYGIDLIHIDYLHWFEFNALMEAVPETTELKKRIHYRSIDTDKIKDKNERKRIKAIQKKIAIKGERKAVLSDEEIGAAFG